MDKSGDLNKVLRYQVCKHKQSLINKVVIQNIEGFEEEVPLIFNDPVPDDLLVNAVKLISYKLPIDYVDFLKTTNGCMLFDQENSLYSIEAVLETKDVTDSTYGLPELLIVAYILQDYIMINLKEVAEGKQDYMYTIDAYSPIDCLKSLNCDFQTWLNRFILCQGNKYWEWL
ncbi:SMI1/KNR4 family protein [Paenibacillus algicola]|uniref:SMI1/KNR4 family protein n=1 Tax=Paenibacillus algicola TaxID=2565926 RepID=UPI00158698FF|nr:SMI1/KNR4 family protein [Paenibacillus algicola]